MKRYSFLLLIIVLAACTVAPSAIDATPTGYISTATLTPKPTSSPRPTSSPVPPTPTLSAFLRSLQLIYSGGSSPTFSIYLWQGGKVTIPVREYYYLPCMPNNCNQILFSDDGQLIAYTSQEVDYELSVVKKDGADYKLLVDFTQIPGSTYLYGMGWIPNTHLVWFNTIDNNHASYYPSNDLYVVNADTGELKNILTSGQGGDIYPSPDGEFFAIVRPESIEIRKKDGRKIPIHLDFDPMYIKGVPALYPSYPIPLWAEDSSYLAVAISHPVASTDNHAQVNIWKLPVTATTPQLASQSVITLDMHMSLPTSSQPISKHEGELYPISISPDLAWFIYSRNNQEGAIELHLATLDLSSDAIIYAGQPGYEYVVGWLPSSKEYFIIEREEGHWQAKGYFLGNIEGKVEPFPLNEDVIYRMDWLDDKSYLYVNDDFDLRLGTRGETKSILIERGFSPLFDAYDLLK